MSVTPTVIEPETIQRHFVPAPALTRRLTIAAVLAALAALTGILAAPERTWPGLLVAAVYMAEIGLGALLFLATQAVASGGWYVCFKRVPEALAATLPYAGGILLLTIAGGMGTLYEWSHADVMAADPLLGNKSAWLNVPFFLGRTVLVLAIWTALALALGRVSRRQDAEGSHAGNRRTVILGGLSLVLIAPTFSMAAFDWLMSLEAHWFSTLYAGYHFARTLICGLATITIAVILLRREGVLRGVVSDEHLHDLGKLMFGFTSFWAYLWFSQYMLIWYGNLPEEVSHYQTRHEGAWAVVAAANVIIGWVIPFLMLLPMAAKRSESLLLKVSGLLLVGHWVDLYLAVQGALSPAAPALGIWELVTIAGGIAVFLLVFRRGLAATDLLPRGDAYLRESLHHHQ